MFLGHFGVGFGAKAAAPQTSLGSLFLASQFIDLLWPTLLLVGLEQVEISPSVTRVTPLDFTDYPISHSLVAVLVWGVLFAGAYFLIRRYRTGAWVCGAAVVSHWLLDLLVHRPDLPLAPGVSIRVGFGLWALVAFLLLIYAGNVFGEPPPSALAIAWVGQAQWLLVIWAYWIDRHREVRRPLTTR